MKAGPEEFDRAAVAGLKYKLYKRATSEYTMDPNTLTRRRRKEQ